MELHAKPVKQVSPATCMYSTVQTLPSVTAFLSGSQTIHKSTDCGYGTNPSTSERKRAPDPACQLAESLSPSWRQPRGK